MKWAKRTLICIIIIRIYVSMVCDTGASSMINYIMSAVLMGVCSAESMSQKKKLWSVVFLVALIIEVILAITTMQKYSFL